MLRTTCLAFAALTAAVVVAAPDAADARDRRADASVQTQRGSAQGTAETRRRRGERSREATVTGAGGRTTTVEDTRRWDRREGTRSRERTRTFPDGDTRSVESNAERTAPGQWSAERTVTGRNGETRTQTGDFAAERTETGRVITGDVQTQNHGQVDYAREISRGPDGRSVATSATFEDGTSVSRNSLGSCDGAGNCARDTQITNRAGAAADISETRTRTEAGAVYTRSTQLPDGDSRSVELERVGNGDGTGEIERTVTDRNGEARTQTGTYQVTRDPQ